MDTTGVRARGASAAIALFAAVVLAWGASGVLFPRVWLERVFRVPLSALAPEVRASLLAEFRFLQAREIGVGLFALALRREVLADARVRRVFLAVVAASPIARALSVWLDGAPAWFSRGFLATESLMALALWWLTRP